MGNNFTDQHDPMTHCYTSNQIIRYLYNEMHALEHIETEYAVEHTPEWREKYQSLKEAFNLLPKVQFFPKGGVIKSILKYSEEK